MLSFMASKTEELKVLGLLIAYVIVVSVVDVFSLSIAEFTPAMGMVYALEPLGGLVPS